MTTPRDEMREKPVLETANRYDNKNDSTLKNEYSDRDKWIQITRDGNKHIYYQAKFRNYSTDFEVMDFLLDEDGEVEYVFKSWDVTIASIAGEGVVESLAETIMPYITYNIVYQSGIENEIDFYNGQYNVQQTSVFDVKDNTLYLRMSSYIKKYFDSDPLIVPEAKILVDFKNPSEYLR